MRRITLPRAVIEQAHISRIKGSYLEYAVAVNWPELRLTEDQIVANAVARAAGQPEPYEDHSIFAIELEPYQ